VVVDQLLGDHQRAAGFMAQPLFTPNTQSDLLLARFQPGQLIADRFLVVHFIARFPQCPKRKR
jgi:hypothetical protein